MASSQSHFGTRHKSIKSLQKSQVSKKETDCTVDDLKEVRPIQVGLDEGVLRELLRLGLESEEQIESFFIADDPEIRKAARRIKLERRLQQSQIPKEEVEVVKAPTETEIQMERSMVRILELLEDSRRNITAVRTCSVKDEISRQAKERQQREELDKFIEEECEKAQKIYDEINYKWKTTSESSDILEIHDSTEDRKVECRKLIEEKDTLIASLKFRLKQADRSFNDELAKQDDYMKILEERISDQISVMNDCYRRELQNLQNMVNIEKNEILNERKKQWEKMAGKKEQLELENMVKRFDYLQEYEEQIDSMMIEQHETMRDQKMVMENKLNKLTVEENRYQSAVLISKELLNYNVQVLQKRQDENRVIKGQQKRIVNRLQDLVRKMQQEQKKEIRRLRNEKNSLQEKIKNLHANVNTLNVRLKNLAASSNKKYFQLWEFNQGVAEDLIDKLVKADKKFHASLLSVSWHVPSVDFSRKNLPSYVEAKALLKEMKGKSSSNYHWPDHLDKGDTKTLFSLVLDSIENKTEFLIDDTLKVFLEPLTPNSRKLITINSLFDALGMREKTDIEYMSMFFLRYVVCKDCERAGKEDEETLEAQMVIENAQPSPEIVSERLRKQFAMANMVIREEFCSRGAILNLVVGDDDMILRENAQVDASVLRRNELSDEDRTQLPILAAVTPSKLCETNPNRPSLEYSAGGHKSMRVHDRLFCRKPGHTPSINPIHVSRALNDFVSKLSEERRSKQMVSLKEILTQKTLTESRLLSNEDVERYWRNFLDVITEKRKLMWKSLLSQMKVHYKTLLKRHALNDTIVALKKRNKELLNLLSNYLDHKDPTVQQRISEKLPFLMQDSDDSLSSGDEGQ